MGWVAADRPGHRPTTVSPQSDSDHVTAEVAGRVDLELVAAICHAAGGGPSEVDVVVDPLDATGWVHLPASAVSAAVSGLRARGVAAVAVNDHRIHVIGWDVRLLRWRLGVLLAGIDTLTGHRT